MTLADAIYYLAEKTHNLTDDQMSYGWKWRYHGEGVRMALIGIYHELRELAVALAQARQPLTPAQQILGHYHAGYRDWQTVFFGITEQAFNHVPAPNEWPLRRVMGHMLNATQMFYCLVNYGLERQRNGLDWPTQIPDSERERIFGSTEEFDKLLETAPLAKLNQVYEELHQRALADFASIATNELDGKSLWWEGEELSLYWRLHRFDAHLRQHTVQAEKTRVILGLPTTEAHRLLRLVYQALAEVETQLLGNKSLLADKQSQLANLVFNRADEIAGLVEQTPNFITAIKAGEATKVSALLKAHPSLIRAQDEQGQPIVMVAAYHRQVAIAEQLIEAGAYINALEGAALGRLDLVQAEVAKYPEDIAYVGRDGFTALHLACYFGHAEVAKWLIGQGSDVNAKANNPTQLTPLHAAAACNSTPIVEMLLAGGSDVHALQTGGISAFHTAASRDNVAMMQLLLSYGVDANALTDNGQSALDIATAREKTAAVAFLQELGG